MQFFVITNSGTRKLIKMFPKEIIEQIFKHLNVFELWNIIKNDESELRECASYVLEHRTDLNIISPFFNKHYTSDQLQEAVPEIMDFYNNLHKNKVASICMGAYPPGNYYFLNFNKLTKMTIETINIDQFIINSANITELNIVNSHTIGNIIDFVSRCVNLKKLCLFRCGCSFTQTSNIMNLAHLKLTSLIWEGPFSINDFFPLQQFLETQINTLEHVYLSRFYFFDIFANMPRLQHLELDSVKGLQLTELKTLQRFTLLGADRGNLIQNLDILSEIKHLKITLIFDHEISEKHINLINILAKTLEITDLNIYTENEYFPFTEFKQN